MPAPLDKPRSLKMSRRRFLRLAFGAGLTVCAGGSLVYANAIEPGWLRVNAQEIRLEGLSAAFDGYQIAHFSDIHMDDWMNQRRLLSITQRVNALRADVIVITGDFVTRDQRQSDAQGRRIGDTGTHFAPGLRESLEQLRARDGVFAVPGNHDHWTSIDAVSDILHAAGVRQLRNDVAELRRGTARLWLCGIDDVWAGEPDMNRIVSQLERVAQPQEIAILLSHAPDFADQTVMSGRFALQLSGHSHGGQVSLPLLGPPLLPLWGQKYHTGLYHVCSGTREMWQFTTRGVGMIKPRLRFNCPPEISLLTLRSV